VGVARVGELDVVRQEQAVRRQIGLIYGDQRSFYMRLSLRENLRFYAALYGMSSDRGRRRTDELIELVGLRDSADVRMHYFSMGMKQRAAIARGLLSDPQIIFLDEPTTAVDPVAAHEIRRMVRERVAQGGRRTVILSTNQMEEAEMLCSRLALLNRGRIEMTGTVGSLRERFQPDETYVLSVGGVDADGLPDLRRLPGVDDVSVREEADGLLEITVSVRRGEAVSPEVVRRLVAAGADVWSCARKELSLDEMFRMTFGRRTEAEAPAVDEPSEPAAVGSAG
jgi:ABC-2 type transport system ATP-binding protein